MNRLILTAAMVCALLLTPASYASSISWHDYSPSMFSDAKKADRPVMVFAMSDTCHWCEQMLSQTFSDPKVIGLINANYYPVMLHADTDPVAVKKYRLKGVPTIMFFSIDGRLINKYAGVATPAVMAQRLNDMTHHR